MVTKAWLFDIIDEKTRYLLATHLTLSRRKPDVEMVMRKAIKKAGGQIPKFVLTDQMNAYPDGIEFAFENRVTHIPVAGLTAELNTNLIERWHGTLKSRTKVMRGLKKPQSAKLFIEGWLFYYNYLRPHESLNDETPAKKSGIKVPFENWVDVVSNKPTLDRPTVEKITVKDLISPTTTARKIERDMHYAPKKPKKQKEPGAIYYTKGKGGKTETISRKPIKGKRNYRKRGRIVY